MRVHGDLERSFDLGIGGSLTNTTPMHSNNNMIFLLQVLNFTISTQLTDFILHQLAPFMGTIYKKFNSFKTKGLYDSDSINGYKTKKR